MTTDTTTTATLTRYGIIAARQPLADAAAWCPYETAADATEVRRHLDRRVPQDGPYRVVKITMTLTEEGSER